MDNLISREDAVSRISDLLILELKGARIPTWNEVYNAIGDIPSVPAVPLDKLCEWLEKKVEMECDFCRELLGEECEKYSVCGSKKRWKEIMMKFMEEQHEHGGIDPLPADRGGLRHGTDKER